MPKASVSAQTVRIDHVRIASDKPFAKVKAAFEALMPPIDHSIFAAFQGDDVHRAAVTIFSARDRGGLLRGPMNTRPRHRTMASTIRSD